MEEEKLTERMEQEFTNGKGEDEPAEEVSAEETDKVSAE